MTRVPFLATHAGAPYQSLTGLPVSLLLDNVRSLYNVGSFFRTADAAGVERILLCGITGAPPKLEITKTALGAEQRIPWEHHWDAVATVSRMRTSGYQIAAVETTGHSVDLFDWQPVFPVCVMFGNEVMGLRPELLALADVYVRIPMLGSKYSLNVATAGGVVVYELLRKLRAAAASAGVQ